MADLRWSNAGNRTNYLVPAATPSISRKVFGIVIGVGVAAILSILVYMLARQEGWFGLSPAAATGLAQPPSPLAGESGHLRQVQQMLREGQSVDKLYAYINAALPAAVEAAHAITTTTTTTPSAPASRWAPSTPPYPTTTTWGTSPNPGVSRPPPGFTPAAAPAAPALRSPAADDEDAGDGL